MCQHRKDKYKHIQIQLARLDRFMDDVLARPTVSDRPHIIFSRIERLLRQLNLDSRIQSSQVIMDAYIRTHNTICSGVVIERLPAWFNSLSFKIIQEYSRKSEFAELLLERLSSGNQRPGEGLTNQSSIKHPYVEALLATLEELDPEELELLNWKVVRGLSWQEVRECWITCKEENISEPELREKGERALQHLRKGVPSITSDISFQTGA